jgi:hypothetical protein
VLAARPEQTVPPTPRGAPERAGFTPSLRIALLSWLAAAGYYMTKKDDMRAPVSDRRPRAGMTVNPRRRQSRPMPMSALAVRRGQFGEFELRPVREHTVEALTAEETTEEP